MAAQYHSIHRYAKISPRKARLVIDLIRGKPVEEAFQILRFTNKRGAFLIHKVLKSAVSNAQMSPDVDITSLKVSEARIDGGPIAYRWMPRGRGVATPIIKRTSHIVVSVEPVPKTRKRRGREAEKSGGQEARKNSESKPAESKGKKE